LQLRAVEKTELEQRLAKVEHQIRDVFLSDGQAKSVLNKLEGD